jgi:uncharacterized RDD family membrane protein YckC
VARWTQTWLSGLGGGIDRDPTSSWAGRRFGMPPEGPGSVASLARRFGALAVDFVVGALIGRLVGPLFLSDPSPLDQNLVDSAAVAVQLLVLQTLTGQSIGMRLFGIRVARVSDPAASSPGFLGVAVRTALLLLVVPAVIQDRDGRGLHDKGGGTVVLRR